MVMSIIIFVNYTLALLIACWKHVFAQVALLIKDVLFSLNYCTNYTYML